MITTGLIKNINISTSKYIGNKYQVELNLFQTPGDSNKKNYTYDANCSAIPGQYSAYNVGDKVYVGFINDDLSLPVILGKIYQGIEHDYRSHIYTQNLNVKDTCTLPINTQIGEISYKQLLRLFNKKDKRYFQHLIICETSSNLRVKFKLLSSIEAAFIDTDTDENAAFDFMKTEFYRVNSENLEVCEVLDSSNKRLGVGYIYCSNIENFKTINLLFDSKEVNILKLLSEKVVEI